MKCVPLYIPAPLLEQYHISSANPGSSLRNIMYPTTIKEIAAAVMNIHW